MALFLPRAALQRAWPWTKNVERILQATQPQQFPGSHLMVGSDYSGDHGNSRFRVYSYLVVDTDASASWPNVRRRMRQTYLRDGRRMSFKALGDKVRKRALIPFLETAEEFSGHLVAIVVTKELTKMSAPFDHAKWVSQFGFDSSWSPTAFEAMCRTAHMFALLLGLWSRPMTHVTWITDEDAIAANESRLDDTHRMAASLTSLYLPHRMGVFAMNTTAIDEADRAVEDFVAIPDLAAGMLSEVFGKIQFDGALPSSPNVKLPSDFSEKSQIISSWFWWPHSSLQRTCILIDRFGGDERFRVQRITMN